MAFGDGLRSVVENFQDNRTERIQARQEGRSDRAETRAGVRETRIEEGETVLGQVSGFVQDTGLTGEFGPLSFGNPSAASSGDYQQQGTTENKSTDSMVPLMLLGVGALFLMSNKK